MGWWCVWETVVMRSTCLCRRDKCQAKQSCLENNGLVNPRCFVSPALRLQLRLHIYNGIRVAGQRDEGQHEGLPSLQLDILTATADMSACLQVSDSRSQGHSLLFSRHSSSTLSLLPSPPSFLPHALHWPSPSSRWRQMHLLFTALINTPELKTMRLCLGSVKLS